MGSHVLIAFRHTHDGRTARSATARDELKPHVRVTTLGVTVSIHGSVPKAIAIGLVEAAPFVLSTMLALAIGLGRIRVPPRSLLIGDCVLRSLTFVTLGILAISDQLTLPILIAGLLFGAIFRLAGSSGRRLLATSIAGRRRSHFVVAFRHGREAGRAGECELRETGQTTEERTR